MPLNLIKLNIWFPFSIPPSALAMHLEDQVTKKRVAVRLYNGKLTSSCLIEDSLSWIRRRSSSVISSSCTCT